MKIENSDSFVAHVPKTFAKTSSPQQCREFIHFYIISMVNPIGLMKTCGKFSCTKCTKEIIEIIDNSQRRYIRIINDFLEVYGECFHIPIFHRFTQY